MFSSEIHLLSRIQFSAKIDSVNYAKPQIQTQNYIFICVFFFRFIHSQCNIVVVLCTMFTTSIFVATICKCTPNAAWLLHKRQKNIPNNTWMEASVFSGAQHNCHHRATQKNNASLSLAILPSEHKWITCAFYTWPKQKDRRIIKKRSQRKCAFDINTNHNVARTQRTSQMDAILWHS